MKILIRLFLFCLVSIMGVLCIYGCGVASNGNPKNLLVTPDSTVLLLSWDGVSSAVSYNIYWSASPGVTKESGEKIEGVEETEYLHSDLKNGTTYYYVVTGVTPEKETAPSEVASGTPEFKGEKDFEISIPMSTTWADKQFGILSDKDGYVYLIAQIDDDGLFEIRKYDSEGVLDKRFGSNGVIRHSPERDTCLVGNFTLNSRQELLVTSTCGCSDESCEDEDSFVRIYRYLSSGDSDSTFGTGGFINGDDGFNARGIKIDDDNNIYVTGDTAERFNRHLFLAKYSDSGKETWLFDAEDLEPNTEGQSILFDSDGNIIVAQDNGFLLENDPPVAQYMVWKIKSDGSGFVNTFGTNGAIEPSGYMTGNLISSDSSDNFLTNIFTGYSPMDGKGYIFRYDSEGNLDKTFAGGAGKIEPSVVCPVASRKLSGVLMVISEYGGKFIGSGVAADDLNSKNLVSFVCIFDDNGELDTSMFDEGYYYGPDYSFAMGISMDPLGRLLVGYHIIDPETDPVMLTEIKVLRYK